MASTERDAWEFADPILKDVLPSAAFRPGPTRVSSTARPPMSVQNASHSPGACLSSGPIAILSTHPSTTTTAVPQCLP